MWRMQWTGCHYEERYGGARDVDENTIHKMSQGNEATSQLILGGVHALVFWTQYLLVTW